MMIDLGFVSNVVAPHGVDEVLVLAIAHTESGLNRYATRFEPRFPYILTPETFAKRLGITTATERVHQQTSWGLCQLMGTVARELNFDDHLPKLCEPVINLSLCAEKLKRIQQRYKDFASIIAAYNAGEARLGPDGRFKNQGYVDKVVRRYNAILSTSVS